MTLSDKAKYSMTRSVARSLCDSWASCYQGCPVLEDLIASAEPGILMLQEHWLTPAELCLFNSRFTNYIYGATRMHSADYAMAGGLSVRPSHAGIVSKRLHISSKFFSPSGSPIILVFPYHTEWQYSDGDPLTGALRWMQGGGNLKITIFDQCLALSRNGCKIEP